MLCNHLLKEFSSTALRDEMKISNTGFAVDSGAQYFISKYREAIVIKVFLT